MEVIRLRPLQQVGFVPFRKRLDDYDDDDLELGFVTGCGINEYDDILVRYFNAELDGVETSSVATSRLRLVNYDAVNWKDLIKIIRENEIEINFSDPACVKSATEEFSELMNRVTK